jgi:GNAT superfamily N-acetyltransferase
MIAVVTATSADWVRYRALRLASLADAPDAFLSTAAEESGQPPSWWRDRLAAPDRITVLAALDGRDVGVMGAGPHDGPPPPGHPHERGPGDAILYGVWVADGARGSGVADAMLGVVVRWARARGHGRLLLDVGDHNPRAIAFYRRAGFAPTGRTSAFPPPRDHVTEQEMALDL